MKERTLVIELHYLPCIEYFVHLSAFDNVLIDPEDIYRKQTYRNRCRINGANNIENLIVPITKSSKKKPYSCEVEIDYNQKWLNKHIRAMQSAYGKAPFFEYYGDEIFEIYNKKPRYLFDLNKALLTKCSEILELDINIDYAKKVATSSKSSFYDARNDINPKKPGSKKSILRPIDYFQVFGSNFVTNLSIVDLIFCEGPGARQILAKSRATE